jgi:hypothetical protein
MQKLGYKVASIVVLFAGAVGTSASAQFASPRQVKVAIDPRSSGETEAELLAIGFHNSCPNVSIVRDESAAEYVVLASQANSGFFIHYYITVYDKQGQGKVVFTADKHLAKNTVKAFCQFMSGQK